MAAVSAAAIAASRTGVITYQVPGTATAVRSSALIALYDRTCPLPPHLGCVVGVRISTSLHQPPHHLDVPRHTGRVERGLRKLVSDVINTGTVCGTTRNARGGRCRNNGRKA